MISVRCFVVVVVVVVAAGCQDKFSAELAPEAKLASDLAVFVRGKPLSPKEAAKRASELGAGEDAVAAYVDDLLSKPMSGRLAKDLVIAPSDVIKDRHPVPAHSTLRSSKDSGQLVYFLRKKCSAEEAEKVMAWWGDEVLICPDSHRPTVLGDKTGRSCGASMLAPRDADVCGCGPHLMYCTRNDEHFQQLQEDFHDELLLTAAYVVDNDLPVEKLFTMNETVRNRGAETLYRRARIAAGEDAALLPVTDFPESKGELRPRVEQVPGQMAGVLSTPALTYGSDALRGVMRNFYDYLWCSGVSSSGVTTEAVMQLKVADLRVGDGWKELASMNICTDCHARLDYGMQFFWGYPSSTTGVDFRPAEVRKGQGPLYANDIKDDRGVADLTPQGFAQLAVAQPEFAKCTTKKIVDHVFNGTETSEDFAAVLAVFQSSHRVKPMLRTAMLRYAKRSISGGDAPTARPPAATTNVDVAGTASSADTVKVSKALAALIEDKCIACHDKDDTHNFTKPELPLSTLAAMLDQVGFGAMPKTATGLTEAERLAFVYEVARHVFPAGDERDVATAYVADGMRGLPVHRFRSAMSSVHERSSSDAAAFRPNSIESAVSQSAMRYSPSIAVSSAVVALRACKGAKLQGPELEACVERSTSPGNVIAGPLLGTQQNR